MKIDAYVNALPVSLKVEGDEAKNISAFLLATMSGFPNRVGFQRRRCCSYLKDNETTEFNLITSPRRNYEGGESRKGT